MPIPKKPDGKKEDSDDLSSWLEKLTVGISTGVILGGAVGAAYALYSEFSGNSESKYKPTTAAFSDDYIDPTIVIAVDATSTRAGGIARIPKAKKIYFYSIDWSQTFQFQETHSDKFEMANGLLALKIFGSSVRKHKEAGDKLVMKGDNSVFKDSTGQYGHWSKKKYKKVFEQMKEILESEPFQGVLNHATAKEDMDMKCADALSKRDFSHVTMESLPELQKLFERSCDGYSFINLSLAHQTAVRQVALDFPIEFCSYINQ